MGFEDIAREILERNPETVAAQDNEGKTPLHYAAALKDGGAMYDLLVENGADESKLDNVSISADHERNKDEKSCKKNLIMFYNIYKSETKSARVL